MSTQQINSNSASTDDSQVLLEQFISLTPTAVKEIQSPVFTLALAHEIKNPLTNINLATELLEQNIPVDEKRKLLDIIARSSLRISDIIIKLLENYQAKEVALEINHVNLLLDEVLALINDRITLKNIIVKKHYTEQDCKVLINKPQIIIALINIMINAIDAMPAGKGELKLTSRSIKGACIIEIEDNGIGISNDKLKNIFKPYFTDKAGGMGLGLSTTLTTLLSNHARIKVYSEESKGSSFVLFFERISAISERFNDNIVVSSENRQLA